MPNPPEDKPRRGARELLRGVALAIAVVLAVAVLVLIINPSAIAMRVTDQLLPRISLELGRQVQVEEVEVSLLPRPSVELRNLTVAGGEGEPNLVAAESARAVLELWPLLRSFGNEVRLRSVTLSKPELTLVRRKDGSWSVEDLGGSANGEGGGASADVTMSRVTIRGGVLSILDRSGGKARQAVVLQNIEATARDVGFERPFAVDLRAGLGNDVKNLTAELALDRLPADWGALKPEEWPALSGTMSLKGVPLAALSGVLPPGLNETVTGGLIHADGTFGSREDRTWTFTGPVRLEELKLRDETAQATFDFSGAMHPADSTTLVANFGTLQVRGPGVELSGEAKVAGEPMKATFDLKGPKLDLDALMAALPEEQGTAELDPNAPQVLIGEDLRASVKGIEVSGSLQVDALSSGPLVAQGLQATAQLKNGVLSFSKATAQLFGGTLDAAGTKVDLLAETPKWELRAALDGLDLGAAMQATAGTSPLRGRSGGKLQLTGFGNDWMALRDQLTGTIAMRLEDGTLAAADLAPRLAEPLTQALKRVGKGAVANRIPTSKEGTKLQDLSGRFRVRNGWLELTGPLAFESGFGSARLGGRVGLDQQLDLAGTVTLQPSFVAQATGNNFRPKSPLELPVEIAGTLTSPQVKALDLGGLARQAPAEARRRVEDEARKRAEEVERRARRKVQDRLKNVLPR